LACSLAGVRVCARLARPVGRILFFLVLFFSFLFLFYNLFYSFDLTEMN
jgi:hypothetical protein